ncbi:MAG: xanthine dehydrogenase family protein molybdopterin-binding subunit [Proteobacteria bacterium]|nr:xanthine dehydrogenase family protein molybdopterin-binding subunit [Pseudomonadota bacterium]
MSATGIGAPLPRSEDRRLLTGRGAYAADFDRPDALFAAFVRSPHAHAAIRGIDVGAARAMPGVKAVLTGADAAADGLGPIPHNTDYASPPDARLRLPEGFTVFVSRHLPLSPDIVRFVGEPVAMVIADTAARAEEAAEQVMVDYVVRNAVVDARDALKPGAPTVWDGCAGNLALTCEVGDRAATDRAFAAAAHVVSFEGWVHRVNGTPMEPRSVLGEHDAASGRYTLRTTTGAGVIRTRERLASILGVPLEQCRCVFGDMGGNFGTRNAFYPEYALLPWAARRLGRPVRWTASRLECFMSDYQARDLASRAELALDASGRFLGLRGVNTQNLGAQTVYFWPLRKGLSMMQSVYAIPAVHFEGHAVLTHTAPTAVYRSAGRPEAVFVIERLIELAARQLGMDRVELRRRNLIAPDALPYTNGVGVTYDSGDYAQAMDRAVRAADWAGFAARRAAAKARGLCRGIAVANYIEVTSGFPRERAELKVCDDDVIELVVGTMSSGQGHETTFCQLASDWLQVPFERIRFVANDSDRVSVGGGSHSGRSMRLVSLALRQAVDDLLAAATPVAASLLQAEPDAVRYAGGAFSAGDASVDLATVVRAMRKAVPRAEGPDCDAAGEVFNQVGGFPYGAHACEVEVDPETGRVAIVAWTGVDDVGLAVNPLVLHGQAHGSATQGIGQALCEEVRYDPASAQLLSASFQDYALPRADMLPSFVTEIMEVPASSHALGIRPGGEGGTTPALGLLVNAIVDALSEYGVTDVEMPTTPQRVWRALETAKARRR